MRAWYMSGHVEKKKDGKIRGRFVHIAAVQLHAGFQPNSLATQEATNDMFGLILSSSARWSLLSVTSSKKLGDENVAQKRLYLPLW